jgi:hypothetical protein
MICGFFLLIEKGLPLKHLFCGSSFSVLLCGAASLFYE